MTGTTRKITASRIAFAASERCGLFRYCRTEPPLGAGKPRVTETGVVMDVLELGIDISELLANALDERPHVGAEAFGTIAGDEILAMHQVVDLAVRDVLAGAGRHRRDDAELGQGEVERLARPARPVDVEAQLQTAEIHRLA